MYMTIEIVYFAKIKDDRHLICQSSHNAMIKLCIVTLEQVKINTTCQIISIAILNTVYVNGNITLPICTNLRWVIYLPIITYQQNDGNA